MTRPQNARLWMLAAVAVWGATFALVKDALSDISPCLFNTLRLSLAFLCVAIVYRRQWKRLTRRAWIGGLAVGLFLAIGFQFQTTGLRLTTPAKSAFITALTVVLVPLLAGLPWLRPAGAPPPRWNVWLGALLAFAGIALLTMPAASGGRSFLAQLRAMNRGDLLSLACALGFTLQIIVQDHYSKNSGSKNLGTQDSDAESSADGLNRTAVPFEQLALLQLGFAAVFMGVTTPLLENPFLHLSGKLVLSLAITSVLATAAAFSIQSWAQQVLPPSHLVLILALEPVFAWLTSLALLGEGLSLRASAGAALIMAAMGAAELIRPRVEQPQASMQDSH